MLSNQPYLKKLQGGEYSCAFICCHHQAGPQVSRAHWRGVDKIPTLSQTYLFRHPFHWHTLKQGCNNNNNNNNNEIYIAPFTMCTRRLEELRKKIRFELVFKPVHVISQLHSPGWARVPLSSFFLKLQLFFLTFPQTLLNCFLILTLWVGD